MYDRLMPKLWNETIAAHRTQVRDAILDTTAGLVFEHGLRSVTMAQIAERTGIGRATLYKYFSDVEAILLAWHTRQMSTHLASLVDVRDRAATPERRLHAVLAAYAHIAHQTSGHHDTDIGRLLHSDEHHSTARHQLHTLVTDLVIDAAQTGDLRRDVPPTELAGYCLHALNAAADLPSQAAVDRLVTITLDALRPPDAE